MRIPASGGAYVLRINMVPFPRRHTVFDTTFSHAGSLRHIRVPAILGADCYKHAMPSRIPPAGTVPSSPSASAGAGGLRARRRAATIDVIIDSALALTAREGLHALTMHRLAADVGCVVSALYRYFENKDALFMAMQSRVLVGVAQDLAVAAGAAHIEATALTRLVAVLTAYRDLPLRRPSEFLLLHRWLGDPGFALADDQAREQWRMLVARFEPVMMLLEGCVREGSLTAGDARERLYVLWGALQGAMQLGRFDRLHEPALESTKNASMTIKALLIGFGASPADVDRAFAERRHEQTPLSS